MPSKEKSYMRTDRDGQLIADGKGRRSARAVFDEHERTLPKDRWKVNEVLGIGP
jgi:hypothetical protein